MKLKERLQEEQVYINPYTFKLTKEGAEKFEQIADEFAIGFAEWLSKSFNGLKSVEQTLEIYKKEKGL
jgi:hypothetical protein